MMKVMNETTNDTRQHILDVGYQLIVTKGFTKVGLSELLKLANVPKGSFYHYFKSKELFGTELIHVYFKHYLEQASNIFNHPQRSGYDCLLEYFEYWKGKDDQCCNANKCLVVKLSAEVSDLSEPMRLALRNGADQVVTSIAGCIEKGIADGSIKPSDSQKTAHQLYFLWVGASVLNKLYQDQSGLHQCLESTKDLLKPNN
ncbi:HTH-type transcriptional repressor nemR [Moellerella wisconsensis]|nr:HTH-type transcriptional repressor nemR [Moellerella wisconsensis]